MANEGAGVGEVPARRSRIAPFVERWGPVLGTALAYFVAARLAMRMVSSYGWATAVWPAAGLALASALRFGLRVWPGIFLGAFAGNVGSTFQAERPVSLARSTIVAAVLAVGCTLEVVIAVRLVLRSVREPRLLADERDIWKFCLLAGPVACVVSATWANVTLRLAGLAPWATFPIGWATWWVGDIIGVILFCPLALILAESSEPWRRRRLPVGCSMLAAFALVTGLFVYVSRWEQARLDFLLAHHGEVVAHALDSRLAETFKRVESIAALMSARPDTSREQFRIFVHRQRKNTKSIQLVSWSVRVGEDEREAFEDAARRAGLAQFRIVERSPEGGLIPAATRAEHVVAYYLEPTDGKEGVTGFDLASEARRLEAIRRAAATGRTVLTAPMQPILAQSPGVGVLVISPAYPGDATPGGASVPSGFGVGVLRIDDMVTAVLRGPHGKKRLGLVLEDEMAPPGERLLYTDLGDAPAKWWTVLDAGGRRWRLGVAPTAERATLGMIWIPWAALAGGLLFVGLFGILLLVFLGRATRVELLAAERARLVEELRGAVSLRDEFLAVAAHELRTPLTSLQLQLQLAGRLLRTRGPGDPAPRVESAIRQAGRLGRLVDDLLNASRLTAGRLTLHREECDLGDLVRETIARHDEDARKAGCTILLSADSPARGLWDCARLEQVITNLLSNALKFGAGAPIRVTISAGETSVTLAVQDGGIGIPPEAVDRIFRKFERGVSARSYGGLGLGLFISREIVAAHGGSLRAESAPGRGATLIMVLPRSPAPAGGAR